MQLSSIRSVMAGLMVLPAQFAVAQDAASGPPESGEALISADANQKSDTPVKLDETGALSQLLIFGFINPDANAPVKPLKVPTLADPQKLAVIRSERPNGSSVVTVKQALSNEWNANIGADLRIGASSAETYQPERTSIETKDRDYGAAWASLGVTSFATIDARVDSANDHGQLEATLKHSMPVGSYGKVTIQDAHSVAESLNTTTGNTLTALSNSTHAQTTLSANASQVVGNQQTVKLDLFPTGTSLAAILNSNSTDPLTHKSLRVDQKLMGPLHVTTVVTDIGQPTANKQIAAGFKLNW